MSNSPFDELMRDSVTVIKPDGRTYENIKANVQSELITIHNDKIPLEEDDVIVRTMPNGLREEYIVLDRGFRQEFFDIPARYKAKVKRITKSEKEKPVTPETMRRIMEVISRFEGENRNTYVADAQISHELSLPVADVRDYLDILEREGKVRSANSFDGHSALLTALGRIALRDPKYQSSHAGNTASNTLINISGTISGSILNINSTLNSAQQTITSAHQLS